MNEKLEKIKETLQSPEAKKMFQDMKSKAIKQLQQKLDEAEQLLTSENAGQSEKYKYLDQYIDMLKKKIEYIEENGISTSFSIPETELAESYEEFCKNYDEKTKPRLRHQKRKESLKDTFEGENNN
ncbi:MAG: hypothetical protein ACI4LX_02310 [Treponema sp.]